ncbi:hypothetical protein [Streptomyces sp. NPDC046685]|uniref:hypothetical protein n=1 Tax=Streptomyces sp. NPDC046685 TaxID=3157202 RepID=UPI0033DDC49C
MTERTSPSDWVRQQQTEREQQPARHTVDTITSDARNQLHAELEYFQQLTAEQGQALSRATRAREEQRTRAEQAEAAITRVRDTATCWEQMPSDRHVYIHEAARALHAALDQQKEK